MDRKSKISVGFILCLAALYVPITLTQHNYFLANYWERMYMFNHSVPLC